MAAGDGLIKITALKFTTQDVSIRFDVGVEKTGGAFVKSDDKQLTMPLREFLGHLTTQQKTGLKNLWDMLPNLVKTHPSQADVSANVDKTGTYQDAIDDAES